MGAACFWSSFDAALEDLDSEVSSSSSDEEADEDDDDDEEEAGSTFIVSVCTGLDSTSLISVESSSEDDDAE